MSSSLARVQSNSLLLQDGDENGCSMLVKVNLRPETLEYSWSSWPEFMMEIRAKSEFNDEWQMRLLNNGSKARESEAIAYNLKDSRSIITSKHTFEFYEKDAVFPVVIYVVCEKKLLRIVDLLTSLSIALPSSLYSSDGSRSMRDKNMSTSDLVHTWASSSNHTSAKESSLILWTSKLCCKMCRELVYLPLNVCLLSLSVVLWASQSLLDSYMLLFIQVPIFLAQRHSDFLLHWVMPVLYYCKNALCVLQMKINVALKRE